MFRLIKGIVGLLGTLATLMAAADQIRRVMRNRRIDREMDKAMEESRAA